MTLMLAARAHPSHEITVEKIPVPEPTPIDVIVKVASAGLAPGMATLLKMGAFKHLPTTLGHEGAGTVAAVGREVESVAVGDRVRIHPNLNCRDCSYCRTDRDMMCAQQAMLGHAAFNAAPLPLYNEYHDGALAEYVRVPHWLIDPLPSAISFDVAAKVHDLANAVRALKCAQLRPDSTLAVTAATGAMGTATVKLSRHFGVSRLILIGRSAARLQPVGALAGEIHTEMIALEALPDDWASSGALTQRLRRLTPTGVDAVVDYIPDGPVTAQAMAVLATGGTLVHMGASPTPLPFPAIAMMTNCWRFVGTRACTRNDALEVLGMLESGTLSADELITHHFPLTDAVGAVAAMQQRSDPMWMTVVHP